MKNGQNSHQASEILRTRARALAVRPGGSAVKGDTLELLQFSLAQEAYALETQHVREVQPFKDLTPLPCTPSFLLGIVNLRGRILPVLDLKKFFKLPETGLSDLHRIILVQGNGLELGLLVDVIKGVQRLAVTALQPPLPTLTGIGSAYLKGVTAERLIVLDLARILEDPKIIVHEEVEM